MLGQLGRKPELAVPGWEDWELKDKADPQRGEDLLVAAIAEDFNFFFREDITARARLSALWMPFSSSESTARSYC